VPPILNLTNRGYVFHSTVVPGDEIEINLAEFGDIGEWVSPIGLYGND